VRCGEYAVEDDRDVGEEFGNNVEGACLRELLETARKGPKNLEGRIGETYPI
jgi:hypothetical protein